MIMGMYQQGSKPQSTTQFPKEWVHMQKYDTMGRMAMACTGTSLR